MNKEVLRFIDRLYRDLYKSDEVLHHSTGAKTDKFNNIKEYLDNLERIHNKSIQTERRIILLKRLYIEKYVIKKEDIPDSYYKNQERIALERGYGHIRITHDKKQELANEIINNQKKSLEEWLNYFSSEDSKFYPFWVKYWAFQGMLKLGVYDKSTGIFNKRTRETVAPFADLNHEALSLSMDLLIKYIGKEEIEDKELEKIISSGSFQKIYPYILKKVLSNNENITKRNEGIWIKYDRGSDHMPLVKSLQGYNTGWCTAGESTAKMQLEHGDFYVYYTLDENNKYKVPRITIRIENDKIAEIRGIATAQNLEPEMEQIVTEKIKDFPDKDKYYKKVNDMKQMTNIYNKWKNHEHLDINELAFLYEIYAKIEGFGYDRDPRIYEILGTRSTRENIEDLNTVFKNIDTIENDLDLSYLISAEGLKLPQNIEGSLDLSGLTTAEGLKLPQNIEGSLDLSSLISAEGLGLPKNIGGYLYLSSLTSAEGLKLPQNIERSLDLSSLTSAECLELPKNIGGYLYLSNLTSAKGLVLPQYIGGYLVLNSLTSAEGLVLPDTLRYEIKFAYFSINPENVDEYRNNSKIKRN